MRVVGRDPRYDGLSYFVANVCRCRDPKHFRTGLDDVALREPSIRQSAGQFRQRYAERFVSR